MYFYTPIKISKYTTSVLSYMLHYLATKVVGEFRLRACVNLPTWFPEVTVSLQ